MLTMFSFSALADMNFIVGKTFGSDSEFAPTQTFTTGVEIHNKKYLLGTAFTRGGSSGYKDYITPDNIYLGSWSAESDHFLVNLYGGKYLTDNWVIKGGAGIQRSSWSAKIHKPIGVNSDGMPDIDMRSYGDSGNTYYAMVGAGYHYKNLNINLHYNHALNSGISGVSADKFHNLTALVGVKF